MWSLLRWGPHQGLCGDLVDFPIVDNGTPNAPQPVSFLTRSTVYGPYGQTVFDDLGVPVGPGSQPARPWMTTRPDGTETPVDPWMYGGVQVAQRGCTPSRERSPSPCLPCGDPGREPYCEDDEQGYKPFARFEVYRRAKACDTSERGRVWRELVADFQATWGIQVAHHWWKELQASATSLSGGVSSVATPTNLGDAIDTILRNYGTQGLNPGVLYVPSRLMRKVGPIITGMREGLGTAGFSKVVPDVGFGTAAPASVLLPPVPPNAPPAASPFVWIYASGPATVAWRDHDAPTSVADLDSESPPSRFWDEDQGCFRPHIIRDVVVSGDMCPTWAVCVDVREGGC